MVFEIHSSSFQDRDSIPSVHTRCDGADTSPHLAWSGVPEGTKSLALIVDDPDAPNPASPKMTWVHWVLYNIPPSTSCLERGANKLPPSSLVGLNDWKELHYSGPSPPIGRHRYFHKLYALDVVLPDLGKAATKKDVENAMQGHVLGQCVLMGTYAKRH